MQHLAGDFARLAASPVGLRHSFLLIHRSFCRTENPVEGMQKFSYKILLPPAGSSFSSLKVFNDCSGGNSRPSRPSGVGGGTFLRPGLRAATAWQAKTCLFLLALAPVLLLLVLLLDYCLSKENAQHPRSNAKCQNQKSQHVSPGRSRS